MLKNKAPVASRNLCLFKLSIFKPSVEGGGGEQSVYEEAAGINILKDQGIIDIRIMAQNT